jgi:hypothetical protein
MDSCTGKNRPPYRVPCAGGGGSWTTGGAVHQHGDARHIAIPVFTNVALVADYRHPSDPAYVGSLPPYAREAATLLDGLCVPDPNADCQSVPCGEYDEEVPCLPPCGSWVREDILACGGGQVSSQYNCYVAAETTEDRSVCRKRGFKVVQARKVWHGRVGFFEVDGCATEYPDPCFCNVEPEHTAPPSTHYLFFSVTCALSEEVVNWVASPIPDTDPQEFEEAQSESFTNSESLSYTIAIDRYSGVRTLSSCSRSVTAPPDYTGFPGFLFGGTPGGEDFAWPAFGNAERMVDMFARMTYFCGAWRKASNAHSTSEMESLWKGAIEAALTDVDIVTNTATASASNTELSFSAEWELVHIFDELEGNNGIDWSGTASFTIGLGGPYTAQQNQDDVDELLAQWDLTDDAIYPWRTDGNTNMGPLVTRHENATPVQPTFPGCTMTVQTGESTSAELPWLEQGYYVWPHALAGQAKPALYTGEIIGAPNPAGYGPHWDLVSTSEDGFGHVTWALCGSSWYITAFGAASGSGGIPASATAWTNAHQAAVTPGCPPGAWRIAGPVNWAQKGAWIKEDAPSQNFFRPCGADRATRDQSTIDCATDPVGDLRWPDAWPICGRIRVADANESGGIVTIELAEAADNLATGDEVDFTNAAGTVTEGPFTITVVDPTHFTYSAGVVPAGLYVKAHDAPDYFWHDNSAKGQFVVHVWGFNYRDFQERARYNTEVAGCQPGCGGPEPNETPIRENQAANGMPQAVNSYAATTHCLPRKPCAPAVVCISPNGESFPGGLTLSLGDALPDDRYGARWQAEVQFLMADLLWEAPHTPCVANGSPPPDFVDYPGAWVEDNGNCQSDDGDTVRYYAHRPYVEALAELPAGAPVLPAGIFIGWLSLEDLDTPTPPDGNVAVPPGAAAVPGEWELRMRQEACVCAPGRFAAEYQANLAICYE